jgi:hypothetical protein
MSKTDSNTSTSVPIRCFATLRWALRITIGLNALRFALSFVPQFEGTAHKVGMIDRMLGAYTIFGFRADFAWLIGSTIVIFLAIFYLSKISTRDSQARFDMLLCVGWSVMFLIYVIKSLMSGLLFPG